VPGTGPVTRATPAPAEPGPLSRGTLAALAGICLAAAILYGLYWTPTGVDDAWITYRYAENLAGGRGFVYNVGERILGTTTPLYTLLLAAAGRLGLSVPLTGWTFGFAGMIAAIVLLFLLVRRLHNDLAGLFAAGLLAGAQLFHRVATYGMETTLYVTLILGAFLAYVSGRQLLASALAAGCLLTRLDGGAVGLSLAIVHVLTRREMPWKALAVYAAIAAPWYLFSHFYFGSMLPNSLAAKRLHTQQTVLLWMPRWLLLREPRTLFAVIGAAVALLAPATRPPPRPPRAAVLAIWGAIYAGAYSLVAIQRYDWYQTPLLVALAGFGGIGVVAVGQRLAREGSARVAAAIGLAGVLMLPDAVRAVRRAQGDEGILGIERVRHDAALWMRDSLPPGVPIATGGIGLVGYFTGRHIYDAMGLVTPGSMRIEGRLANPRGMPFPRFLPAVIADYRPEYVFDGFWLPPGEEMPDFMRGSYEVVRDWRGANPSWPRFILYRRITPR